MTTTTVSLDLTCPDWCTISAEDHVSALWDTEANLIHHSADQPVGAFDVSWTTVTRPDGRPSEAPTVFLDGQDITPAQARELAAALIRGAEAIEQSLAAPIGAE
ncbi:DUF6907 domain-containing protein [Nocardioides massiliensis]|uniref:Uncharacterized protein n=1 Tax=Nocardioides massiliensis TaxID=1325935 RepID=A0ABT9NQS2_9ACTN|nr:hypothetical protein [Nocardioides massiliensis]MDP9822787.1 hypothetical protein [Nocardioides massiliensis]